MQIARLFLLSCQKVISMSAPTRRTFIMKTAGLARKVSAWGLLALMSAGAVQAAEARYPKRPIRLVVPFTPGGSTDIVARVMADAMQASLGQPVVVENRAGASGLLGAEAVAHSAPDGYTIGLGTISTLVVNPIMLAQTARLNPAKAFVPVVALASIPSVFSVHPSLGVNNYAQFVSVVRAQPGQLNIGSAGMGSIGHLIAERMNADLKIKLHHIPYKGQGPVVSSALSGETQVLSDQYPSSAPYVAAARLIPLAVAAQERLPGLPQVPTFTELGYPELNDLAITWFGIVAPAGTPQALVLTLNKAANAALQSAEVQERLQSMNVKALGGSPSQLTRLIEEANRAVRQTVQEQGLKPIKAR